MKRATGTFRPRDRKMCRIPRDTEINKEKFGHRRTYRSLVFEREHSFQFSSKSIERVRSPQFVARGRDGFRIFGRPKINEHIAKKPGTGTIEICENEGRARREHFKSKFAVVILSSPVIRFGNLGEQTRIRIKRHRTRDQIQYIRPSI